MGFLTKLFGIQPSNPTESFPRRLVPPQIIWDTTSRTLSGIPLPSPLEALVTFGPSDRLKSLSPHFQVLAYYPLGLEIEVARGKVQHFTFVISEDPGNPEGSFVFARPLIAPAGKVVGPETTVAELTELLGPGEKMFEDEEETIFLFRSAHVAIEAAYNPVGRLVRFEVYNDNE